MSKISNALCTLNALNGRDGNKYKDEEQYIIRKMLFNGNFTFYVYFSHNNTTNEWWPWF